MLIVNLVDVNMLYEYVLRNSWHDLKLFIIVILYYIFKK